MPRGFKRWDKSDGKLVLELTSVEAVQRVWWKADMTLFWRRRGVKVKSTGSGIMLTWICLWIWHRECVPMSTLSTSWDHRFHICKLRTGLLHHRAVCPDETAGGHKGHRFCLNPLSLQLCPFVDCMAKCRPQVIGEAREPVHVRIGLALCFLQGPRPKAHSVALFYWFPKEALFLQLELELFVTRQCAQPQAPEA